MTFKSFEAPQAKILRFYSVSFQFPFKFRRFWNYFLRNSWIGLGISSEMFTYRIFSQIPYVNMFTYICKKTTLIQRTRRLNIFLWNSVKQRPQQQWVVPRFHFLRNSLTSSEIPIPNPWSKKKIFSNFQNMFSPW